MKLYVVTQLYPDGVEFDKSDGIPHSIWDSLEKAKKVKDLSLYPRLCLIYEYELNMIIEDITEIKYRTEYEQIQREPVRINRPCDKLGCLVYHIDDETLKNLGLEKTDGK